MIAAAKLDNLAASSIGPRQPQRAHRGLGTRIDEADHLHRGNTLDHQLRQSALRLCGSPKTKASFACLYDRFNHRRIAVPQYHWSPGLYIVKVAVAIHIIEIGPMSMIDKDRITTHTTKSTHRAVDPARQYLLRLLKQAMRARQLQIAACLDLMTHCFLP